MSPGLESPLSMQVQVQEAFYLLTVMLISVQFSSSFLVEFQARHFDSQLIRVVMCSQCAKFWTGADSLTRDNQL